MDLIYNKTTGICFDKEKFIYYILKFFQIGYFEIFSNWVLTYANGWSSIRSKEAPILFFLIQRNRDASFFCYRKQDLMKEKTMQTTRLQKQHMNMLSSLPMSLDFVRKNSDYDFNLECPEYTNIKSIEGKYETWIRQPRCRNGG